MTKNTINTFLSTDNNREAATSFWQKPTCPYRVRRSPLMQNLWRQKNGHPLDGRFHKGTVEVWTQRLPFQKPRRRQTTWPYHQSSGGGHLKKFYARFPQIERTPGRFEVSSAPKIEKRAAFTTRFSSYISSSINQGYRANTDLHLR